MTLIAKSAEIFNREVRIIIQSLGRARFTARHGERVLCKNVSQPETTAARALLEMGITGRCEFWHHGAAHASLVCDIERLAGLTVTEEPRPRFTTWRPFSERSLQRVDQRFAKTASNLRETWGHS